MFDASMPGARVSGLRSIAERAADRGSAEPSGPVPNGTDANRQATRVFLGMPAIIVSEPMTRLLGMVERVARSNATVLITGESGSGKEIIARAVHHYSPRTHKPWVDLSCAALPEHLIESELFGYDRGAFSGADSSKPGLFELAHQGTIFLDEIGELEPKMQVKLLRVLDGAPYYRLGGTKKITVDVRVVAATNQELEIAVAEGRFRSDLYHRLSQITLRVPPLRKRADDIAPLAHYFLAQQNPRMTFAQDALDILTGHSWPGNIRELRNVVVKAALLAHSETIVPDDLPLVMHPPTYAAPDGHHDSHHDVSSHNGLSHNGQYGAPARVGNGTMSETRSASLEGMEKRMIMEALHATGGHQQKAAARLGISRRTLSRKLKLYESENAGAAV
jgi:transcriptional regulator with PAS, ATPase and Fis domain